MEKRFKVANLESDGNFKEHEKKIKKPGELVLTESTLPKLVASHNFVVYIRRVTSLTHCEKKLRRCTWY